MLQQEVQLNKLRAQMELQAARFEEALKREKMQSEFDVRQANLLAQAETKTAVATAQLYAAQQIKDHMQAAELVSMQAIAERLDQPREQRPIKDINSDALVKCPIDKSKDDMLEWGMAMAAITSGLCENASEMIAKVMARDVSVVAYAMQPENVQADRWLARQINASIKDDTEAGKLFHKEARGGYDAALCMYHDQALIPLKTINFHEGVNVTIGLPFVRTSPDHGTAFDIAGTGRADPASLLAALRVARQVGEDIGRLESRVAP